MASLTSVFRNLNLEADLKAAPAELQYELVAALTKLQAIKQTSSEAPQGLSPAGAATPLTGQATPSTELRTGKQPPPNSNSPIHPPPPEAISPLFAGNVNTDQAALPYIHSIDRIDVNKMLTEAERRIGLFEGATPSRPTYFPPLDPQYRIEVTKLIKHRLLEVKHGKFSGSTRDYDNWADKIADHWADRQQTWPSLILPEDLKIAATAELLDDQRRKAWVQIRKKPISDKGKLFTLREYLTYFRTYWGQRKDNVIERGDWVTLKQTGSAQAFIRTVRQKATELNPPAERHEIVGVIQGGLKRELKKALATQARTPDAYTSTEEWLDWVIKVDQALYTPPSQRDRLNAVDTDNIDEDPPSAATNSDDEDNNITDALNVIHSALKHRGKRSDKKKSKKDKGKSRKRSKRRSSSSRSRSPSPEETRTCYYCQEPGHLARNCPKKKEDKEKKQKEKERKDKKKKKAKKDSSDSDSGSNRSKN